MSDELAKAARYYKPLAKRHDGMWAHMYVDEYGPGIPHQHWEAMKAAGWFRYKSGSYILGPYEIWEITDAGRAALKEIE